MHCLVMHALHLILIKSCLQQKKQECGTILTLDGGCINPLGVTKGDSYKPASLQNAAYRFASTP